MNNITCKISFNDIQTINKIKSILLSISHVDKLNITSINSKIIEIDIAYFGNLNEIINIFKISNLAVRFESNSCFLNYETI